MIITVLYSVISNRLTKFTMLNQSNCNWDITFIPSVCFIPHQTSYSPTLWLFICNEQKYVVNLWCILLCFVAGPVVLEFLLFLDVEFSCLFVASNESINLCNYFTNQYATREISSLYPLYFT